MAKTGEDCSKALGRGGIEFVENFEKTYNENDFFHVDLHCLEYKKLKKFHPSVVFNSKLETNLSNIEGSPVHLSKVIMNLVRRR